MTVKIYDEAGKVLMDQQFTQHYDDWKHFSDTTYTAFIDKAATADEPQFVTVEITNESTGGDTKAYIKPIEFVSIDTEKVVDIEAAAWGVTEENTEYSVDETNTNKLIHNDSEKAFYGYKAEFTAAANTKTVFSEAVLTGTVNSESKEAKFDMPTVVLDGNASLIFYIINENNEITDGQVTLR